VTYTLRIRLGYIIAGRRWTMTLTKYIDWPILPRVGAALETPFGYLSVASVCWDKDEPRVTTEVKPLGCITEAEVQRIGRVWLDAGGRSVAQDEERPCEPSPCACS
jgi:hypothetical protein